jgi:chemotaxis protein histidine kinase CheA
MSTPPDLETLLKTDIHSAQQELHHTVTQLLSQGWTDDNAHIGLRAAHTLKALAAVRGNALEEAYAAQLEQLFFQATMPNQTQTASHSSLGNLRRIHADYLSEQTDEAPRENPSDTPNMLDKLLEQLQKMEDQTADQSGGISPVSAHPKNRLSDMAGILLLESFRPWLTSFATAEGKSVQLCTEIDSQLRIPSKWVDPMQTILVHLLRNAISHGIEPEPFRKSAGKPLSGTITITLKVEHNHLILIVGDDGQGMSATGNRQHPVMVYDMQADRGSALSPCVVAVPADRSLRPLTGLGVGLHIVKAKAEQLAGAFYLHSALGLGSSAIIEIPLMLADTGHDPAIP